MKYRKRKRKNSAPWIFAALMILALLVGIGAWVYSSNEFSVAVTLNGESTVTLEYGQSYEEPGATAVFYGSLLQKEPVQLQVQITGNVDTTKLGSYVLHYTASYDYFDRYSGGASRVVQVVDTQAPVITLNTVEGAYTPIGQEYKEEGFTATDNYDGDLTDQVQTTREDGKVYYTVADSSGNQTTVVRDIVYFDPNPPVLTLRGGSNYIVYQGDAFSDPGYEALDQEDGDITDRVVVSGTVDSAKMGTYTLTYTVKDRFGNQVSVNRTVTVREPLPPIPTDPLPPNGKVICLTFDDGPSKHTDRLLDILKKYNVKATFFVVNTGYLSTVERIAAEGHTVALHTYTHNFDKVYASEDAYFADLIKIQNAVYQYTGQTAMIIRFPGGTSNTISKFNPGIMSRLVPQVKARGFRYFDWNVDSNDAGGARTADQVYENVVKGIGSKSFSVVLQHDTHGFSVDAVERIIQWGLANGYTFEALDMNSPACQHKAFN